MASRKAKILEPPIQSSSLEELQRSWAGCERCNLCKTRKNLVFGVGNPQADILLVGEGPGEQEDRQGLPFVGDSGEVLNIFLRASQLDRDRDLYLTNVVCCQPFTTVSFGGRSRKENRPPTRDEWMACWPRLRETIYHVDPKIIITMGATATTALLRKNTKITSLQGRVLTCDIMGMETAVRYTVVPMFHPAYLLRNPNKQAGGPWCKTGDDFVQVCTILDHYRNIYRDLPKPRRSNDSRRKSSKQV